LGTIFEPLSPCLAADTVIARKRIRGEAVKSKRHHSAERGTENLNGTCEATLDDMLVSKLGSASEIADPSSPIGAVAEVVGK
jgi:hypothetical protein